MAYKKTGETVEMLWNCPNCGTTNILARNKKCPNCGRSRSGSTYLGDNPDDRTLSDEDKKLFTGKADRYCLYCDSLNPSNRDTCMNCGSPKGESEYDYFDIKRKEQEEERKKVEPLNHGYDTGWDEQKETWIGHEIEDVVSREYSTGSAEYNNQQEDRLNKVEKAANL